MSTEVEYYQQQVAALSNTVEALKQRCVELEFQIVNLMAERIAHNGVHQLEGMLSEQAASQLPDRHDN